MKIERIEILLYRAPLGERVRTSFGTMRDRPMLIVRVTDRDGAQGVGEVWCNFPSSAADARRQLLLEVLAPMALSLTASSPNQVWAELSDRCSVLALQSGEPGPFANCLAGLEMALSDLSARRAGVPLSQWISPAALHATAIYASALSPEHVQTRVPDLLSAGWRGFKLKVGFDPARDMRSAGDLAEGLPDNGWMAIDANQKWAFDAAVSAIHGFNDISLKWIEEPMRADAPETEWRALATASRNPLAGGENLLQAEDFRQAAGWLAVLQPDPAKWGGLCGGRAIAKIAAAAGLVFCPHFLGGGVGLTGAAHLLAATDPNGVLEVDSTPNPLREILTEHALEDPAAGFRLSNAPGLGLDPDLGCIAGYLERSHSIRPN